MPTLDTLQVWLSDAETALHLLQTGSQRVTMDRNGTRIAYTPANAGTLRSYCASLRAQIRAAGGTVPGVQPAPRGILYNRF